MRTATQRDFAIAPLWATVLWSAPAAAGSVEWLAPPAMLMAGLWLAALGWGFHALLRRRLHVDDRLAELEAELCLERRARAAAQRCAADGQRLLHRLARQQESVRECERQRIARDLHDDLGQHLLALKLDLTALVRSTAAGTPAVHRKAMLLAANVDLAVRSLRTIVDGTRPTALAEGLRVAIARQLSEFSRVSGIAHQLHAEPGVFDRAAMQGDLDIMLYRAVQESLANVARHARATEVQIVLDRSAGQLTLLIRDNGVGMRDEPSGRGCGLSGMQERVLAAGGELVIASTPGGGTTIALTVPVPELAFQ